MKRGWVANGPDFEWDLISGPFEIWISDPYCTVGIQTPNLSGQGRYALLWDNSSSLILLLFFTVKIKIDLKLELFIPALVFGQ